MGLDDLLDNTEKNSQHIVLYDKQMHQITHKNQITCYKRKVTIFTSVTQSQIQVSFSPGPAVFVLSAILRQVHRITPKWPQYYKAKDTPYIHNYCPRVLNFNLFHSTESHYWVIGHFETCAPNEPKMNLNTMRSKVPHIFYTITSESQVSIHFALQPPFSSYRPFWDNCTQWPRNDIEHYEVKGTP